MHYAALTLRLKHMPLQPNILGRMAVLASLLAFANREALAQGFKSFGELGYETSWELEENRSTLARPYALLGGSLALKGALLPEQMTASLRARQDFSGTVEPRNKLEVEPRELTASYRGNSWQLTLGLQQIAWGETFGLSVIDLVNPRDLRESPLADPADTRLPTWSINQQLFFGAASLQLIATPKPAAPKLPEQLGGIPLDYDQEPQFGKEGEYGFRLGYLFSNGLDVKAFYLRHWSRLPAYELDLASGIPRSQYASKMVDSSGFSFTQAIESFVFRGDVVYTLGQPVGMGAVAKADTLQSIVGADYTFENGLLIGGQHHMDQRWLRKAAATAAKPRNHDLRWISAQMRQTLFSEKLEMRLFAFRGLGNSDQWIRPELTTYPLESVKVSLAYDYVNKAGSLSSGTDLSSSGYLTPWRLHDRLWSRISWIF